MDFRLVGDPVPESCPWYLRSDERSWDAALWLEEFSAEHKIGCSDPGSIGCSDPEKNSSRTAECCSQEQLNANDNVEQQLEIGNSVL